MIVVRELTKNYSGEKVLDIPSLTIARGESFGIVGNNGAGKTTFFRLVLDLIRATSGSVFSNDLPVARNEIWKHYTGSYLDEGFLIDFLTPEEYFQFISRINGLSQGDITEFYDRFHDFFNDEILGKKKLIRDLSKGNQKKVGIAAALMKEPQVLVLDEPFNSLDPTTQIRLKLLLNDLQAKGEITMLISSHDLKHITEVCDRIVILDKGLIVKDIYRSENTLKEVEDYFYTQIYRQSAS
ncbi:MAG: ABC transporter ATP-binding protein [Bacteroidales bacterium]|nr:ABC transporter ATP-binding protein [Lentimicrobiaceae bacterium]MDD5694322.1 ABC transporter ATP-binding protein [Bacteroidales bacterium]